MGVTGFHHKSASSENIKNCAEWLIRNTKKMPNINLIRSHLFEAIGRSYTDKEFDELCFEFGVEVDDVFEEVVEVNDHVKLL